MEFTVCFLFNQKLTHVLLIKKAKTEYAGQLNGVGGELEPHETQTGCAKREIKEEIGVVNIEYLQRVAVTVLSHNCKSGKDENTTLHFYTGVINPEDVRIFPDMEEPLQWCKVDEVLNTPVSSNIFAGDGDVQYIVNLSVKSLKKCISNDN